MIFVGYLRTPGAGSPIEQCADEGDELEARVQDPDLWNNPKQAQARKGLALSLEKSKRPTSVELAEAAVQYKNYLILDKSLPQKDIEKYEKTISKLEQKAAKEAQKENKRKQG